MAGPNTPNTSLILNSPTRGDFEFMDTEVPMRIPFGGQQQLVQHQLPGGARVVDAMGRSDMPLEWSGIIMGADALDRARFIDAMRADGLPLVLTWSELAYSVVIQSFTADFEQFFQIPYKISCVVVVDLTGSSELAQDSVDDSMLADMDTANSLGDTIGNSTLTGLLGTLGDAVGAVSSFATAAQSTINSVLAPVAAVTNQVKALISATANTLGNVATLGGVLPSNPIAQQVASLTNQVTGMTTLPVLYQLQSVVGRMGMNLVSVGSNGQQVATAGGNLYKMATDAYGDPTAWTGIARANGLTDPLLTGLKNIDIPALPDGLDGVFAP